MDTVYALLVALHLISWAVILGGNLATLKNGWVYSGTFHAAVTALLTGLVVAGMALGGVVDRNPPHAKLAIKFVVLVIVIALSVMARRKPVTVPGGGFARQGGAVGDDATRPATVAAVGNARNLNLAIVGLTVLNVLIAVLW